MDKFPLRIVVALALVLPFACTGCIPSPNQPLGNNKNSSSGNQTISTESGMARSGSTNPAFQPADKLELPQPGKSGLTRSRESSAGSESNATGPSTLTGAPETTSRSLADVVQPIIGQPDDSDKGDNEGVLAEDATPIPLPGARPIIQNSGNPIDQINPRSPTASPTTARIDNPPMEAEAAVVMNAPLIPREQLFGKPEQTMARVSPDGKSVAFLAALDGVMNVYVAPIDAFSNAKAVTRETTDIESFFWAYTSRHVIYRQDNSGNGQHHVYGVSLDMGETRDLTPIDGVSAKVLAVSHEFPAEILVGTNERAPHRLHDVHRVNIVTGEHNLVLENPGFDDFVIDDAFHVRFARQYTDNGGLAYFQQGTADGWDKYMEFSPEDALTSRFMGLDKSGDRLFFLDSRGRNTAGVRSLNLTNGKSEMLAENPRADVSDVLVHPTEKSIQAVAFNYDRQRWQVTDNDIGDDLEYLGNIADGEFNVTSRTLDDTVWTVEISRDNGATQHLLYNRNPRGHKLLFSDQPALDSSPLVKMHAVRIATDDGLELVSYLSLPVGSDPDDDAKPVAPVPMVLLVHGGPWDRDRWGYNPVHQLLANRGYAVLSVNFRGSTGFGKNFTNAGNGEWARRMHGDLIQAVKFAVENRIADPDYVAIMGGSYGGYATLVGLTTTPDVFTCGVDIVGPSNLVSLMENPPPYWLPFLPVLKHRVGDHETAQGRTRLMDRSPLSKIAAIKRPLLIAQGAHDPFAQIAEADQIVEEMERREIPVTYMIYPDEGHGLQSMENRLAFYASVEAFFAKYLGGRAEPIGEWLDRADVRVPTGLDLLGE